MPIPSEGSFSLVGSRFCVWSKGRGYSLRKNGALVGFRRYARLTGRTLIFDESRRLLVGIRLYWGLRGEDAYSLGTNMGVSWDLFLCIPYDTPPFGGMVYMVWGPT